jgi:hypothetical protein
MIRRVFVGLGLLFAVTACGDDDGGGDAATVATTEPHEEATSTTESASDTTAGSDSGTTGDVVEVAPVDDEEAEGTLLELGETADIEDFLVTVEAIEAGEAGESVEAEVRIENTTDGLVVFSEWVVRCADGTQGDQLDGGSVETVPSTEGGEVLEGTILASVPESCDDPVLRVDKIDLQPEGTYLYWFPEWSIPEDALP